MTRFPLSSRSVFSTRIQCVIFLAFLLDAIAGCAGPRPVSGEVSHSFDRRSVVMMTVSTAEEGERLRSSLLEGAPLPQSATVIPINRLDQLNPELSKTAMQLNDCEISPPLRLKGASGRESIVVLQRGHNATPPCYGATKSFSDRYHDFEEKAGQLLIGLLMVGIAGLAIVVPYLFIFK